MIKPPQQEFGLMRQLIFGTLVVLASTAAFAQTATVTPDPLPASIATDQATVTADQTTWAILLATLKADQAANNTTAITADKSAIKDARTKSSTDVKTLRTDAIAYLQTANAAIKTAADHLADDAFSGDTTKIAADHAALKTAITQAHADRQMILVDVFKDGALHGKKIGWLKFVNEVKKLTGDEDALADQATPDTGHKSKHASASDVADKSGSGKGYANEGHGNEDHASDGNGKNKSGD
jgi:hypothetical protein